MNGHSVNRYTIESRKLHKSDQRGHLTLKYRRDNNETKKNESVIRIDRDIKQYNGSNFASNEKSDSSNFEGELELELESGSEKEELDDDEELLKELEKIKKERVEREKEKKNNDIKLMMQNNPLLEEYNESDRDKVDHDESDREEYILKKRWTEDTVFRNQNRVSQHKKRFINDILHSDQHREFMRKYIL
ncbi:Pre-mRNA-splicing factor Cwf15/Cwc15 [Cryptosporidium hominis]|uniref:Pre-mRNA-splicing factor Cwf15/Cwc15 n=1 Tax=Cryptosporidium hominis TaxID=237895 RepID=A0ABX5BKP2_CRYHO|nr:Pre-mRNA-splicing factor Cwf15/Cwc15 [Cryptosporidium hominis]|eukprot:PPS98336.1 Pre-mRNA-splicing factor Cwf15/Cwc15 [Cryptosporidium hominis]